MMIWMDSFDRYTTSAQIAERYDIVGSTVTISAGSGRHGTAALVIWHPQLGQGARIEKACSNLSTITIAGAYRGHTFGADLPIVFGIDNATVQWTLILRADKRLEARRGITTAVLGTGTKVIDATSFQHIAVQVTSHNTAGVFKVWVDGELDINLSSQNTRISTNNYITKWGLGDISVFNMGSNATFVEYWDDLYVNDTNGSVNTGYEGDLRIEAVSVDGNGYQNDGTPSAGSAYQCVDETTPNSDTDYVDMVSGDIQAYTCANLTTTSAVIKAVAVNSYSKKTEAGLRTCQHFIRNSSVNYSGAPFQPSTTYDFEQTVIEGAVASIAEVNAMEIGVEIIS